MPESLYGAHPKKLPVRFKLPSHLDLLRFQHAKVKVGSVTAYFGFAPFGVILCYSLADYTITGSDWLYGTIELIAMLVGVVVLPEQFTKSRDTKFIFPSAGYYDRFIGK